MDTFKTKTGLHCDNQKVAVAEGQGVEPRKDARQISFIAIRICIRNDWEYTRKKAVGKHVYHCNMALTIRRRNVKKLTLY